MKESNNAVGTRLVTAAAETGQPADELVRARLTIRGAVQGVGFRPCVFRLATDLGLSGWVNNSAQGVFIELEGRRAQVQQFILRIESEKPQRSFIQSLETSWLEPAGYSRFEIRASDSRGTKTALVLPDGAICADCLREIFDPGDRRYLYPFTNCTNCGPRFSIIEALPYDRSNTSMRSFKMCAQCRTEYENPLDRRFHAQPNACPECGPCVELWEPPSGKALCSHHSAIKEAGKAIRNGKILAVKGLGGFHLMVDARREEVVMRLRKRKHREEKPFAVMFPSIEAVRRESEPSEAEERLLRSAESPIVLLRRKSRCLLNQSQVANSVAPGNPFIGVMLPYTPLHHLLLAQIDFPVVATSGNLSDEPICTDEHEAMRRLNGIADLFLVHNRPIARHVDDSVVRLMAGRELVLRRARGYAPLPIELKHPLPPTLAVGAHLKSTVAISVERQVFISQHLGDLETVAAFTAFRRAVNDLPELYETRPARIAADTHPDYLSSRFARESGLPVVHVQHHYAHILACMAENELESPVFGVAWDGTGLGPDGTVWGGEFLKITANGFERFAHLRTFRLPGGEAAIKEPRRCALGLLHDIFGDAIFAMTDLAPIRAFSPTELGVLRTMLERQLNAPRTSSAGRLFDAISSLVGIRQVSLFEGQAATELEFAIDSVITEQTYPMEFRADVVDWEPMIREIVEEILSGTDQGMIAAKLHNTFVEVIAAEAHRALEEHVVLAGGCFQNKYLTERAVRRLTAEGFRPYWHQRVPPNDGSIALGQVVAAGRHPLSQGDSPCV
jgi:hydrogenase maturation protein HypF